MSSESRATLGAVVIGRNEGPRLDRCLRSLGPGIGRIVYVDSGSTDDSVAIARRAGAELVELDAAQPFTMARGRNAGLERLEELDPCVELVQFVDGDCEVRPGWVERARMHLEAHPDVAVVCGHRRERFPGASLYNRLVDLEWRGPIGDVAACGGDAMMRAEALRSCGAFDPVMIAGEEPELCCRLRLAGWRVVRLEAEMTLHDANLTHFGQWWTRAVRGGHAFAEGARLHGRSRLRHNLRPLRSAVFWGLALPSAVTASLAVSGIAAVAGVPTVAGTTAGLAGLLLLGYPLLALRVYLARRRRGSGRTDAVLYALFCALGKVPEAQGVLRFRSNRKRVRHLIEYK
jgi:GT2 family glycosyltransferase